MSHEQVKALVATLEEEVYRRIQAEDRLSKLEAHAEELARAVIPTTPFGELSLKSQEVKQEHLGAYIQLLLPLYAARELLLDTFPAPAASVSC